MKLFNTIDTVATVYEVQVGDLCQGIIVSDAIFEELLQEVRAAHPEEETVEDPCAINVNGTCVITKRNIVRASKDLVKAAEEMGVET